jgi:uncharacterized membrane protein YvbJ
MCERCGKPSATSDAFCVCGRPVEPGEKHCAACAQVLRKVRSTRTGGNLRRDRTIAILLACIVVAILVLVAITFLRNS